MTIRRKSCEIYIIREGESDGKMLYNNNPFQTRIIYRNGLRFQIPLSYLCSIRFTVTPSGDGSGWDEAAPDIDQALGLIYRANQDLRKGVRKRAEHEHSVFADNTVGMNHLPGGCRILGIVENTADLSTGAGDASIDVTEGRFIGRGIIYDQTNNALWCFTNSDGTTTGDPYLLTFHPDRAWNSGDITWAGAHEFDASIDITGNVAIDGDLTLNSKLEIDGTSNFNDEADFSDVAVDGTFNVGGTSSILSGPVGTDDDGNGLVDGTTYLAKSDGFVNVWVTRTGGGFYLRGYVGDTTNPVGAGTKVAEDSETSSTGNVHICFAVGKGKYFSVRKNTATFVDMLWTPFGGTNKNPDGL